MAHFGRTVADTSSDQEDLAYQSTPIKSLPLNIINVLHLTGKSTEATSKVNGKSTEVRMNYQAHLQTLTCRSTLRRHSKQHGGPGN